MSRLVLMFSYSGLVRTGPASLGFADQTANPVPLESDAAFVVEWPGDMPCVIDIGSVISAKFKYGELSLGLADLISFEIGFSAQDEILTLDYLFSPADTLSSTVITITSDSTQSTICGVDRATGENFEYHYVSATLTASRVPEQITNTG